MFPYINRIFNRHLGINTVGTPAYPTEKLEELQEFLEVLSAHLGSSSLPLRHLQKIHDELEELCRLYPDGSKANITFKNIDEELYSSLKKTETVCSICLDDFKLNHEIGTTECEHIYHKDCLNTWYDRNSSCPMCRKYISSQ
jgi:hypothetical protein